MEDLISVIIPVYNHAQRLNESLLSLSKQTHKNIEVIIVNDGSNDNFNEVVRELLKKPEISKLNITIINQSNLGASAARNRGFNASKGVYVIFWDADTVADKDMLQKMFLVLQKNPNKSYAYSGFKFGWKKIKSFEFDPAKLLENNYIDTTTLIRREAIIPFDETIKRFQDWDLWLSMLEKNKTGIFIPEILFSKRVFGRRGISSWIPKGAFSFPFKTRSVKNFEKARQVVLKKHAH